MIMHTARFNYPRFNYHRWAVFFIYIFVIFISFVPSAKADDLYSFVDEEGVTYYTNIPGKGRVKVHLPLKETVSKPSFVSSLNIDGVTNYDNVRHSREGGNPERHWIPGQARNDEGHKTYVVMYDNNRETYEPVIAAASHRFAVDPDLIRAVIKAESNFNHRAVSPKGAMGLMQLMPEAAKEMAVANPFDPVENIHAGVKYLGDLLQLLKGNLPLALAAYNAGPERVIGRNEVPAIVETRDYVRRVMMYYKKLKRKSEMY